jgi:DNA-binding HxlR family transcriptional regulator
MLGKTYDSEVCSIARSLEVVGERWSLLILRNALFAGSTRYHEFQQSLGIATNVLRDRLNGFVEAGIMARREQAGRPDQFEYVLTEKGRDFAPALIALTQWGDKWAAPDGRPIVYRHLWCGTEVSVDVACRECGDVRDLSAIEALPGPGMPRERARRVIERLRAQGSRVAPGQASLEASTPTGAA